MRRFALLWMAPPMLLLAAVLAPVITGGEAFFLRDVFSVHLEMRHAVAAATGDGVATGTADEAGILVDPYRGGGQPLAYNPNAAAFHPTALAHRVLPFFAAFNLHLWLHLLLAPLALYWLARELGLGRPGAWAAGVTWGFSGFLVSQLTFYNLVAGVALAPALAAAAVRWCRLCEGRVRGGGQRPNPAEGERRRAAPALVAVGILWALLVTAGDPQTAVLALAAAGGLTLAEPGRRRTLPPLAAAVAAGTLLALPQAAGLLAILPASARGAGYAEAMRLAGSFDPRQALGWLIPFFEGRPDLVGVGGFWGYRFHQGSWPFYFTLYPGVLTLALVLTAGLPRLRRRDAARDGAADIDTHVNPAAPVLLRGWLLVAAGIFFALGAFNPLASAFLSLPGLETLRYPMKFWLLAAMGGALVAGVGFSRAFAGGEAGYAWVEREGEPDTQAGPGPRTEEQRESRGGHRRRVLALLFALAALFATAWAVLRFVPGAAGAIQALMPPGIPAEMTLEMARGEQARWAGLALVTAGGSLALAALAYLAGRRPYLGGSLLLTLHAAVQLFLLQPAMVTEETAPYRDLPPILAHVPADARLAHGSFSGLFGGAEVETGELTVPEVRWVFRRTFVEAYPFAGALHGRRYDLNRSPEWLDTAELRWAVEATRSAPDDASRLRLLSAWGISHLLLHRHLDTPPPPATTLAEHIASEPGVGRPVHAYRLPRAAPSVYLATGILRLPPGAPPATAARYLADPRFRPGRDVVLPADGAGPAAGLADPEARARLRVVEEGAEHLVVETSADVPTVLVWQRARLPMHRARVDGEAVAPLTVNLHRVGVPVPAGDHRVRLEVSRGLLHASAAGSAVGLLALLALGFLAGRQQGVTAPS